jgi:hypothetical protein
VLGHATEEDCAKATTEFDFVEKLLEDRAFD